MRKYQVFVQDIFYKEITSDFVSDILKQVSQDIVNGLVPNFDNTKNASIKIIPVL